MSPCPHGLAAQKVPAKKWRTRAELLAILSDVRASLERLESPDLSRLSRECGVSKDHLQRLFKSAYGESPKVLSRRIKMSAAEAMIRQGFPIEEIVMRLSYPQASSFSREFKGFFGMSPTDFRKKCQGYSPGS